MAKDSHRKGVLYEVPKIEPPTTVQLTKERFQSSINSKGYNVTVESSVKCPCRDKATGQSLLNCVNCGGIGTMFVNKRTTVAVIQSMARNKSYKEFSEVDPSTASITFKPQDEIAEMDRVINNDLTSTFTQNIYLKMCDDKYQGLFVYYPESISHCYLFISPTEKLVSLVQDVDFQIIENKLVLDDSVDISAITTDNIYISVRYDHNPVFHIVNITRERMGNRKDNCEGVNEFRTLPIHCIGRRTHYMLDYPGLNGESLEDNSNLDNIDLDSVGGRFPVG